MPQGIQLAGGFGAGGVKDALVDLIAQRMAAQKFEEAKAARVEQDRIAREQLAQRAGEIDYRRQRDVVEDTTRARERGEDMAESSRRFGIERSEYDTAAQERQFNREQEGKTRSQEKADRAKERAEDRAFDASERAKDRAASAARAAASGGNEPLVKAVGKDGKARWVTRSEAVGMEAGEPARSITGQERTTLGFFNRMLEAEKHARAVEDKVGEKDLIAAERAPAILENWLQSKEGQAYLQAQRMFTEARLRKESGAGIPASEYESDRKTNFRTAGDKGDVLKNKRASRLTTMRGIGNAAGRALQEYYGEGATLDDLLWEFDDAPAVAAPLPGAAPGAPAGGTPTPMQFDFDPKTGGLVPRRP